MSVVDRAPPQAVSGPLRRSEGGIALISRRVAGEWQWLAQWNEKWKALFFVGGHRRDDETFHQCVVREIEEELGLSPEECPVGPVPARRLQYRANSRSADQLTEYEMELFEALPAPSGLAKIERDGKNKWLDEKEIVKLKANDGREVSVTMSVLLGLAGLLEGPGPVESSEEGP